MLPTYIFGKDSRSRVFRDDELVAEDSGNSGITLRLRKGDLELEIVVSKDIDEKQIKAIQKLIQPFALGLAASTSSSDAESGASSQEGSMYLKLKSAIRSVFKYGQWFTSNDAKEAFEDIYGSSIKIATCSTYLRRMEEEGFLVARKIGRIVEYRIAEDVGEEVVVSKIKSSNNLL